jgi:hypothetical protein
MNKIKLTALLLAGAVLFPSHSIYASEGWGQKQSSGTITGLLLGTVLGGVVGHQQGKQKEGIIIGALAGSLIGNKTGKGRDTRLDAQQDSRYDRYNQSRQFIHRAPQGATYQQHGSTSYQQTTTDPYVLAAQQRAEALEKQVEQERQRIAAERLREQQLAELHAREQAALKELELLRVSGR